MVLRVYVIGLSESYAIGSLRESRVNHISIYSPLNESSIYAVILNVEHLNAVAATTVGIATLTAISTLSANAKSFFVFIVFAFLVIFLVVNAHK